MSITLVLFLAGFGGLPDGRGDEGRRHPQESIAVTVELENGLSDEQKDAVNRQLTAEDLVATIAYVDKKEKIEDAEFRKMFASEFEEILDENPLLDSFELTPHGRLGRPRSCSTVSSPASLRSRGSNG